jgi:hypothetical protein
MVEVEALANAEAVNGWTLLATAVDEKVCMDVEILQAYQDQISLLLVCDALASTLRGMQCPQPKKAAGAFRLLKRGSKYTTRSS